MGRFSERVKRQVKQKAHFRCCRCQNIGVDVHHILPQHQGGPSTFDNAAPLCQKCHYDFGDNPAKRKEIREMRDWWYDQCSHRERTVIQLREKPEPRSLEGDFPVVLFYHKENSDLHWLWPGSFRHYYHAAGYAAQELRRKHPKKFSRIAPPDGQYAPFFTYLIERLIFNWLSQTYFADWLLEQRLWRFPWGDHVRWAAIKHPGIATETVKYADIRGFKRNYFADVQMDLGFFSVPKKTRVTIARNAMLSYSWLKMENAYYTLELQTDFSSWRFQMAMPQWICGIRREEQASYAAVTYVIRFKTTPNESKLTEGNMGFYQRWGENLYADCQRTFDWTHRFEQVKHQAPLETREILEKRAYLKPPEGH